MVRLIMPLDLILNGHRLYPMKDEDAEYEQGMTFSRVECT